MAGMDVVLMDTSGRALERARVAITGSLGRAVGLERMTAEQAQAALARIQPQGYLEVKPLEAHPQRPQPVETSLLLCWLSDVSLQAAWHKFPGLRIPGLRCKHIPHRRPLKQGVYLHGLPPFSVSH